MAEGTVVTSPVQHTPPPRPPPPKFTSKTTEDLIVNVSVYMMCATCHVMCICVSMCIIIMLLLYISLVHCCMDYTCTHTTQTHRHTHTHTHTHTLHRHTHTHTHYTRTLYFVHVIQYTYMWGLYVWHALYRCNCSLRIASAITHNGVNDITWGYNGKPNLVDEQWWPRIKAITIAPLDLLQMHSFKTTVLH